MTRRHHDASCGNQLVDRKEKKKQQDEETKGENGNEDGILDAPPPVESVCTAHAVRREDNEPVVFQVRRLVPEAALPERATPGSAGFDIFALCGGVVKACDQLAVKTGLAMAMPEGTYGRLASRSGLAAKHAVHVGAGVVDADYRGEVSALLINMGDDDWEFKAGDRVAQLILERYEVAKCVEVSELDETSRGAGGFGSTGPRRLDPSRSVRRGGREDIATDVRHRDTATIAVQQCGGGVCPRARRGLRPCGPRWR